MNPAPQTDRMQTSAPVRTDISGYIEIIQECKFSRQLVVIWRNLLAEDGQPGRRRAAHRLRAVERRQRRAREDGQQRLGQSAVA